ncbi:MAG: peptide chain release factor N(5)-glutamine methyltransferase [Dehalococcoidia bacterium]
MRIENARTLGELTRTMAEAMRAHGIPEAPLESRLLARHAFNLDAAQLLGDLNDPVPGDAVERLRGLLERRLRREPLAYITGEREFFRRTFAVDPRVLVPRPETELLVERTVEYVKAHRLKQPRIADIGTGSGALAITLALELPGAQVVATDLSTKALQAAQANATRLGADITWVNGNLCEPLAGHGPFDVVVSNPPYIRSAALESLEPEISYEPRGALDGGTDGMQVIKPLLQQLPGILRDEKHLVLIEFDPPVAPAAVDVARAVSPDADVNVLRDLAGLERCLEIVSRP